MRVLKTKLEFSALLDLAVSFPLPCHCEEGRSPDVAISRYKLTRCKQY